MGVRRGLRESLKDAWQLGARVERHERTVQRLKGLTEVFGGTLTIIHFAMRYLPGET